MKKPNKRDTINLFFSAFLILAFIVCAHFFSEYTATLPTTIGALISILVFAVFGLLVFYATRVGDGKAVKRFSLVTLIVLVIPSLYIVIASLAPGLPLNDVFASNGTSVSVIVTLASIALGYGIPYTFLSGYEIAEENAENEVNGEMLEGGLEAALTDEEVKYTAEAGESAENTESDTTEETDSETE